MAEQFDEDELDMLDVLSGAANSDNAETLLRDGVVGEPERLNAHFIRILRSRSQLLFCNLIQSEAVDDSWGF